MVGLPQLSVGQDRSLLEERTAILNRIQKEANRFVLNAAERKRLSEQHRFPLALTLNHQRTAVFQYMDGAGQPIYYTTYNAKGQV